jgi:AcrR family transcriptional regulator
MPTVDDPRVVRTKQAVVEAAADLLAEQGLGAVTIEAVAARAAVAKTTIYRHWPDRTLLLLDTVQRLAECDPIPDTGNLRADLVASMAHLNDRLHGSRYGRALPAIIAGAEHDPDLADALERHVTERRRLLTQRLRSAARAGDLPDGIDPARLQALVVGAIFYSRLVLRKAYRPAEIARLVDQALAIPIGSSRAT